MEDLERLTREERTEQPVQEVIGLIPAGGRATRIAPLPCSKELFPIGLRQSRDQVQSRPKAACEYVLERMRLARVAKAYIVLGEGKWDIPTYLGDGAALDMDLAYLMIRSSRGVPYTLDQAYAFVRHAVVALAFADILFDVQDAFARVLDRQTACRSEVVLGVFPADHPEKVDMVEFDDHGEVRRLVIKPQATTCLRYTWGIAAWTPTFTQFMHEYVSSPKGPPGSSRPQAELYVGDVFQAALDKGMSVAAVHVSDSPYIDIGTPDDLARAIRYFG
jgi:glucose-1-phosphate thymidylyltransferase